MFTYDSALGQSVAVDKIHGGTKRRAADDTGGGTVDSELLLRRTHQTIRSIWYRGESDRVLMGKVHRKESKGILGRDPAKTRFLAAGSKTMDRDICVRGGRNPYFGIQNIAGSGYF